MQEHLIILSPAVRVVVDTCVWSLALARRVPAAAAAVATIDALIAAVAIGREAALLTTDADFARIAEVVSLRLLAAQ